MSAQNLIEQLAEAAEKGSLKEVDDLLKVMPEDDAAARDNQALRWAADGGHASVVNRLLEIESVKDNAAAENNWALRLAAFGGHASVVNRLLEIESVKENAAARDNEALHFAAIGGHAAIVNRLLEVYQEAKIPFPADIKIRGYGDETLEGFFKFYQVNQGKPPEAPRAPLPSLRDLKTLLETKSDSKSTKEEESIAALGLKSEQPLRFSGSAAGEFSQTYSALNTVVSPGNGYKL